jgi:FkbM family methyltransferase
MENGLAERLLRVYARYFPLRRGKLRVVNSLWRKAAGTSSSKRVAKLRCGGFQMHVDIAEQLQRQFYFFGNYLVEEGVLSCWAELAREAHTILDVGANRGIYSLTALGASPKATVYAFEPTPEIADSLRHTAEINSLKRLIVNEMAISDRCEQVILVEYRGCDGFNGGMNYVLTESRPSTEHTMPVVATRLDVFCAEHGILEVDLMKVDVQGGEPAVLHGAGALIQERRIRTIFMEMNWAKVGGSVDPAREAVSILTAAGYSFAPPELPLRFRSAGDWLYGMKDVVAVNQAM